jgi:hypothetical protein
VVESLGTGLVVADGVRGPPCAERVAANAYRRHVEPTDDELERLEAVMYIRTLYLVCFGYRGAVHDRGKFREWGFIRPREYFSEAAAATRAAFRRWVIGTNERGRFVGNTPDISFARECARGDRDGHLRADQGALTGAARRDRCLPRDCEIDGALVRRRSPALGDAGWCAQVAVPTTAIGWLLLKSLMY